MPKRVKQYLARNSNGLHAVHTEHRVHCLLLWLFACVLSMLAVALSCLVCCQNALITRSKYTNIFLARRLSFFFFVHFLVARSYAMGISFVWVCAWHLRANVIDTDCAWYEKLYNTLFEQAECCVRVWVWEREKKLSTRETNCLACSMQQFVSCHWYTNKHWPMCSRSNVQVFFFRSLVILL